MEQILNKRISAAFYRHLIKHPVFRDNYTAISGAEYFLLEVARYNDSDEGDSEVFSGKIKELFKNYDRTGSYKLYIKALIEMGLLINTCSKYRVSTETEDGWCKKYKVTEMALELLNNNLTEYLKKLHLEPTERRLNQQRISSRGVFKNPHKDYILNYIYDGLIYMEFDFDAANRIIKSLPDESKPHALNLLTIFTKKNFGELKYNESDGRVWNEYVAINKELRAVSKYKNMERIYTLDIRACHPTFWGLYIKELINNHLLNKEIPTQDNSPYCLPETLQIDYSGFDFELINYNRLFCDPINDPRELISLATGYDYLKCKAYLNSTLNGSSMYKHLLRYLESKFPIMYNIWVNSTVKATGTTISRIFETKLMLNPKVFKLAESLKIKLAYEYDGFSLFFYSKENKAEEKAGILKNFINSESKRLWGLDVVLNLDDERDAAKLPIFLSSGTAAKEEHSLAA